MSSPARTPSPRARLLAPLAVAAALVGGIFAVSSPGSASTADEATLASLVNGARSSAGLPPLAVSGALSDVARAHSASMASSGSLIHSGNTAASIGAVVPDWTSVAENVAVAGSAAEAHSVLMASGEHRAHILGDFTVLGVGAVAASDGRVWVTELFAKTATVAPAPVPVPEPVIVAVVEATVATAAVAPAPAPAPAGKAAKARPTARRTAAAKPSRPARAAVVPTDESCLPEQAQGDGHAYGRCDDVPQGRGRP